MRTKKLNVREIYSSRTKTLQRGLGTKNSAPDTTNSVLHDKTTYLHVYLKSYEMRTG